MNKKVLITGSSTTSLSKAAAQMISANSKLDYHGGKRKSKQRKPTHMKFSKK